MSTSLWRTIKNIRQSGLKRYIKQMNSIGDAKAGTLVGVDDFGNEFYETNAPEEIHLRTRWVEFKESKFDVTEVEPGWHYWLAYGTDTPPNKLPEDEKTIRAYPLPPVHQVSQTGTPGAYVPYNTAKPKFTNWQPKVAERANA